MLAAALLCVASASAQQATTLQISAPSVRLSAGDSMALTGVPLTSSGAITQQPVAWKVDQPSIATVDSSGKLTGVSLGIVLVTATSGNLSHATTFQVTPDHVELLPKSANLLIGERVQFIATAFDINGKPLPNVKFTWAVTQALDDGTAQVGYGTITPTGMLTGAYEGFSYVRALYTYTSPTGTVDAGMDSRIPIYAPFSAAAPRAYTLKRLLNATRKLRTNGQLRAKPTLLYATPNGEILFNASLDGLGTALVSYDGTGFKTILAAGTPSNSAGSIVTDMGRHSLSASGTLLAQESTSDGGIVRIGPPDALQPLLVNNISGAGAENLNGFNLTRNSLTSGNHFVFTAGYKIPGKSVYVNGLFRGYNTAVNEILFTQAETAPELGVTFVNVGDFGVDDSGVAWYTANVPGKQALFRHDLDHRTKFLQVGDTLMGQVVRGFFGGRNSTPGFLFAENGDVLFGVTLADGSNYLLRYTGTAPDVQQPAEKLRVDNGAVVLSYQPGRGVLIWGNPRPNMGDGVWLWNGTSLQPVALIGKAQAAGQAITAIESGVMDSSGSITLMVSTATNLMLVVRGSTSAPPQVLFQAGDSASLSIPTVLNNFVSGGRTGNPVFLTGSTTGASLAEFRDGDLQPLLTLGDRVLTGSPFNGFNPYGNVLRIANGDIYGLINNLGIARLSGGKWDVAKAFNAKLPDGVTAYQPYRIAVNNNGDMAWLGSTDKNDTRLYLARGSKVDLICNNGQSADQAGAVIDGLPVFSCDDFFLDDDGRMLLRLHFQGEATQRTYGWSEGTFQLAAQLNKTQINGRTLLSVNQIRVAGTHLYGSLNSDAGTTLAEWVGQAWQPLYTPASKLPTGFYVANVNYLEGNRNGDIIFQSQSYPSNGVYIQRAGQLATIFTTSKRTPDGDFLVNLQALDIRDDGTVYLLALNEFDEMVFYQATPN